MTMTNDIDTALAVADEQTALVQAEQQLEKLLKDDPNLLDMWGGENLEEGDAGQPPRLKLCQRTTPDTTAEPGQFFNTLTGETFDAIEVIPLLPLASTRIEYFRPYTKGEAPYCASDDGKMPRETTERRQLQNRKEGPCETCPSAKWGDPETPGGKRIPSVCVRQRNFMVTIRQSGELAKVTMQKTGTPSARQTTALMIAAGIRKSMFLTSKFVQNDSGDYYEPIVTGGGLLPTAELLRVIELRGEVDRLVKSGEIKVAAEEESDYTNGTSANGGSANTEVTEEDDIPF
jgi:hypothetical protein